MESIESDSESAVGPQRAAEEFIARVISRMEPERPDILQVVPNQQSPESPLIQ